ncbi:DUF4097 family beta strand repeat-containing protein, partial [Bombilactobacillus bombi]|uniref:DUF4097 family beta strand repeat-containing protein n=1 Tax=Bombilactobacillus bombi TaxID=1303590 RepID=UPI0015E5A263
MKKYYWTILTVLAIGILMTIVGFVSGGSRFHEWDWDFMAAVDSSKPTQRQTYNLKGSFKNIDIDVDDTDIDIQQGPHYSAKIIANKVATVKPRIEQQTLKIIQSKVRKKIPLNFGLGWTNTSDFKIVITVPQTTTLNNVKIDSADTTLKLKQLKLNKLNLDSADTEVYLNTVALSQQLQADVADLEAHINDSQLNNLSLDCGDVDMTVAHSKLLKQNSIKGADID